MGVREPAESARELAFAGLADPFGAGGPERDRPREACGVVAVHAAGASASRLAYFGLCALQHRGQESAGVAAWSGGALRVHKGMGLVAEVFREEDLGRLPGERAIGHVRYGTSGASDLTHAQPIAVDGPDGPLALAHNGNLTNAAPLRAALAARGVRFAGHGDTEVIAWHLAHDRGPWEERLARFMAVAEGAYSLVVLTPEATFALRDRHGFRPLCLGALPPEHGGGHVVASESAGLGSLGARYLREVAPGEIVRVDAAGAHSLTPALPPRPAALCVFEYVYFARPDTRLEGQVVHQVRQRLGRELAREAPCPDADVVVPVPDSSVAAAIGYAAESGAPFNEGLVKDGHIGRTFIAPTDAQRQAGVRLKYQALDQNVAGRRVVLVDDSIVRGTTAGPIVALLREAGAREVHVRISSPPVRHPCFMGVDMSTYGELVAHRLDVAAIGRHIGADSLAFLSHEGLLRAVTAGITEGPRGHCSACFTGRYPLAVPTTDEAAEARAREAAGAPAPRGDGASGPMSTALTKRPDGV